MNMVLCSALEYIFIMDFAENVKRGLENMHHAIHTTAIVDQSRNQIDFSLCRKGQPILQ